MINTGKGIEKQIRKANKKRGSKSRENFGESLPDSIAGFAHERVKALPTWPRNLSMKMPCFFEFIQWAAERPHACKAPVVVGVRARTQARGIAPTSKWRGTMGEHWPSQALAARPAAGSPGREL